MLIAVLLMAGCLEADGVGERLVTPTADGRPFVSVEEGRAVPPTAVSRPTVTSAQTPPVISTLEDRLKRTPPSRDLVALHQRLVGSSPPVAATSQPEELRVGDRVQFWILNREKKAYAQIWGVLRYATPDLYFFVQEGQEFPDGVARESAITFSQQTAPRLRDYFGSERSRGTGVDPHVVILNAVIPGSPGYFSSNDEYPLSINPYSNEREMIYVNLRSLAPGSGKYASTLAHEFQHMIHWNQDMSEEAWVNEGLSELAERLAGYSVTTLPSFVSSPDTQLNTWDESSSRAVPHYGASYAFLSYLFEHYGGYEAIKDLASIKSHGILGIDEYLRVRGYPVSFDDVFRDWVIANLLDDLALEGGRYGYRDLDIRITPQEVPTIPFHTAESVHQYAARYLGLPPIRTDVDVVFTGTQRAKLVPNDPHSGREQWWGNRGDVMDTTLTREFDLTGLDRATLRAWLWFDIEKDYDHAYVEASIDGGRTWTILPGRHATTLNPNGNSFGPAYTGRSGGWGSPSWVEDEYDLTPYAGKKALVRFEYVTDEENNGDGLVVDDVSIPELGYAYDAETDGGWIADGFIRTDNHLRQNYVVQLVKFGQRTTVEILPLDSEQKGRWKVRASDLAGGQSVLVITAAAPATTESAPYELSIDSPS